MKIKALLLCIILTEIISCSKDEPCIDHTPTSSINTTQILTKKSSLNHLMLAEDNNPEYDLKANYEYFYTSLKLDSITSTNNAPDSNEQIKVIQKFTYTGDLITETNTYANTQLSNRTTYQYNNNKQLTEVLYTDFSDSNNSYKEEFEHLDNGNIAGTIYMGTDFNEKKSTNLITFNNQGDIGQIEITHNYSLVEVEIKEIITYTYDDKNYWLKNVIGIAATSYTNNEATGINNNIITEVKTINGKKSTPLNFSYAYDQYGFPQSVIIASSNYPNTISSGQFFY